MLSPLSLLKHMLKHSLSVLNHLHDGKKKILLFEIFLSKINVYSKNSKNE